MKRIAIFHELDFGGARRTVDEFAKRLNKIFDVDLYYVDSKEDKNVKKISKEAFFYPFYPKIWRGNNWRVKLYRDTFELFKLYSLHLKIAKDIKSKNYNYIFVHASKFTQAPFILRFLKNKCIYYCQEPLRMVYDPSLSNISHIKFPKNIYEYVNRIIRRHIDLKNFNNAKIILTNSKFSKVFVEKSYHRKTEVCYLGVDVNFFKPLKINKSIDILFIGNDDKVYNLLKKSVKLFNVKPKLHTIFRNRKTNIADKELVQIYNKSKVLVALNINEPFGLIPLEAMACGTPVIAVGEGGYKEFVIDKKTGFLILRDPTVLFKKIHKIINDDELRKKMAKSSRKTVIDNWTWDKSVDRFLKIINYAK